ncbi:MAG: hypothetical protein FWC57_00385 [Endomicrobia bacterium]|nr:hypothetical protein [Endomicrobiia bacterium]
MAISIKTKAIIACIVIFAIGFVSGFALRQFLYKKAEYDFQYKFEKLEPLTKELGLSDVQKALLFNILADNRAAIDKIMHTVNPKIQMQLHIMRENIKGILDDNQKAVYSRLLKEYEAKKNEEM